MDIVQLKRRLPAVPALLVLMVLTGCGSNPISPPVEDQGSQAPIERDLPAVPDDNAPPASTNAATESLLAAADEAAAAREYNSAIAYLERAVRIDPRNPSLWLRLSAAYLANGELTAAAQHTRKAIALAGDNPTLQRAAWLHMAEVEQAMGNYSEAQALRRRWQPVRG